MKKRVNEKIPIDSLKVRIPTDLIEVNYEGGILDKWHLVNDTTGEIIETKRRKKYHLVEKTGYDYHYSIQTNYERGYTNEYLYLTIHAKQLEKEYFTGITSTNIRQIYDEIQSQKIVGFTFEHFLHKTSCTDVDFKRDFYSNEEDYQLYIKQLKKLTKESKMAKGYTSYNGGVNWNSRKANDAANPNVKVYSKEKELRKPKNWEFKDEFLKEWDYNELRRIEFTVKNKKHFQSLGVHNTSLGNLLNLTQQEKETMLQKVMGKVIRIDEVAAVVQNDEVSEELTPKDQFMLNALKFGIEQTKNPQLVIDSLISGLKDKNPYKYRQQLDKLYENYIAKTKAETEQMKMSRKLWEYLNVNTSNMM